MTYPLKAVVLDIVITKITPKTVYYKLTANQREEKWQIPAVSAFNKAQLVVGQRYRVTSQSVQTTVWDYRARQRIKKERFDWVSATAITPKATIQARSTKQREASELLAAMPLVDNGDLIKW